MSKPEKKKKKRKERVPGTQGEVTTEDARDRLAHVGELEQRVAAIMAGYGEAEEEESIIPVHVEREAPRDVVFSSNASVGRKSFVPTRLPSPFDLPGVHDTWRAWGGDEIEKALQLPKPQHAEGSSLSSDDGLYASPAAAAGEKVTPVANGSAKDAVHATEPHDPARAEPSVLPTPELPRSSHVPPVTRVERTDLRADARRHEPVPMTVHRTSIRGTVIKEEGVWEDDDDYYDDSYSGSFTSYPQAPVPSGSVGYAPLGQPGPGQRATLRPSGPSQTVYAQPAPRVNYFSQGQAVGMGGITYQAAPVTYSQDPRRFVRR